METVSDEDYKYLCDIILNIDQTITFNNLLVLKRHYENLINSNRQLENISSLRELIKILEKRGCLSPKNVSVLYEIATNFNKSHLLDAFHNRMNLEHVREVQPVNQVLVAPQPVLPAAPNTVNGRVYAVICSELGKGWIDFARALKIQEGKIDELKIRYSHNERRTCINEILVFHEGNAHPRVWKTQLLDALEKARRKDLRNSVQNIFDMYS